MNISSEFVNSSCESGEYVKDIPSSSAIRLIARTANTTKDGLLCRADRSIVDRAHTKTRTLGNIALAIDEHGSVVALSPGFHLGATQIEPVMVPASLGRWELQSFQIPRVSIIKLRVVELCSILARRRRVVRLAILGRKESGPGASAI
jgi:hypothetical protein